MCGTVESMKVKIPSERSRLLVALVSLYSMDDQEVSRYIITERECDGLVWWTPGSVVAA